MLSRRVRIGLIVSAAYFLAAKFGFQFAFVAEQVSTVWAPTGIAMAALLLWGRMLWPAVWVAAFAANAGADVPTWVAGAVATGNTLEAITAASILRHVSHFDPRLARIRDVAAFVVIAAMASTTVSATVGVSTLCLSGEQPWPRFGALWTDWWLGDALGALVVAPVILTLVRSSQRWTGRDAGETALVVGGTIAATQVVFGGLLSSGASGHPLEFIIFPFVVLAAVRLNPAATSLVVLAASAVTIWHTTRGSGPFADLGVHQSLVLLQTMMGALSGTGLFLAAAIAEGHTGDRRRASAYAVSQDLATAARVIDAAPALLASIGRTLEWDFAAFWWVDPDADRLRCEAVWSVPRLSGSGFATVTQDGWFTRGVGLPGRVWASGHAAWIEDVVLDRNFPRAQRAADAGVHGAFAFPVHVGSDVVAVVECFHRDALEPDMDLLTTMTTVGNQIGQFVARRRVEAAVVEARRDAEAASRAKDEFLATLSHELRTPLNAIVGWARLLLDGKIDPARTKDALKVIDRNATLQAQLVADILDLSRVITGGLRLNVRPVQFETIIGAALDAVRPAASAKGISMRTHFTASARHREGDPERLQQIVWNLLSNAVKFTGPGGTVEVELSDTGAGDVSICVRDNGIGLDPSLLPHVFERFWQADSSTSRQHGGLGLGLAIARHLVELHGGVIRAESAGAGTGCAFTVELPQSDFSRSLMPAPADGAADRASAESLHGCHVLVVDDEEDGREMVAAILRRAGANVQLAASASDALAYLDQSRTDVLLADIAMPAIDGYELVRRVRARDARTGSRLPAAAITAYAGTDDRARALAAGFDRHLAKPLAPNTLIEAVASMWRATNHADLQTGTRGLAAEAALHRTFPQYHCDPDR